MLRERGCERERMRERHMKQRCVREREGIYIAAAFDRINGK
jgi:hypothetical protein